jgi:hypothetical protein
VTKLGYNIQSSVFSGNGKEKCMSSNDNFSPYPDEYSYDDLLQDEPASLTKEERALIAVHDTVRREVIAAIESTQHSLQAITPKQAEVTGVPVVIPGGKQLKPLSRGPVFHRTQPRSRALSIVLIAISVCAMLTILYAATPLSASAIGNHIPFVAGATNFLLPSPTPTPTPIPTPIPFNPTGPGSGPNPGSATVIAYINSVFGSTYGPGAVNVARCESSFNPNAYNGISVMGSHAEGVFQVLYPSTWNTTSQAGTSPYNYQANILAAHQIFARDGYKWVEWVCQP